MQDVIYSRVSLESCPDEKVLSAARDEMISQLIPNDPVFRRVAEEVVYMRLKTIGAVVINAMAERDPKDVVDKGLSAGMAVVAKLYSEQIYRLPEIMMAAKTMEIGMALAEEKDLTKPKVPFSKPPVSDPHNISTGVGDALLKANGFDGDSTEGIPVMVDAVSKYMDVSPMNIHGTTLMTSTLKPFPERRP